MPRGGFTEGPRGFTEGPRVLSSWRCWVHAPTLSTQVSILTLSSHRNAFLIAALHQYIATSQHHDIITSLHQNITLSSLHDGIITPLHHYITTSQHAVLGACPAL